MSRNIVFLWILILVISLFIIFNYMPSMIELSALENENMIYIQLEGKVKEIEVRFTEPEVKDVAVKATSIRSRRQLEKQIRATRTFETKAAGMGSAIRGSMPLNPFNPDY